MVKSYEALDLAHLGIATPAPVSCFATSDLCAGVDSFPTLEIRSAHKTQRFGPMSHAHMMEQLLL